MDSLLKEVLEEKGHTVYTINGRSTVIDAVRHMNGKHVGALLVVESSRLVGMFTERDVLVRIVDGERDSHTTLVSEVMTRDVIVVHPDTTVSEAMSIITQRRCRHLPVMDGDSLIGLISIGDLTRWVTRHQEVEIEDLVRFITGSYPA